MKPTSSARPNHFGLWPLSRQIPGFLGALMKKLLAPFSAAFLLFTITAGKAYAALDATVTDKIDEVTTDLGTLGGLFLIACIVIAGFAYMKRGAR